MPQRPQWLHRGHPASASARIGRAVALGLADVGASLILLARSADELAQTQAMLIGRGASADQVRIIPADLGDEQQRGRAAATALGTAQVDILVNNAATVEPLGPTAAISAAELRRAFEVNVVAVAALTAAVLPGMLDAGWGRVVNVSSAIVARPASWCVSTLTPRPRQRLRPTPSTWQRS